MSAKLTLKHYFTWRKYVMSLHLPPCAIVLLDYLEINQGENWIFHENNIKSDTGLTSKGTFYKAKKALLEAKLITWQGQKDGIRIRVTYDVQKSDVQKSDVQKSDVQKSDVQKSDVQKSDVQKSDCIERKKTERKEENKIKGEKAAVAAASEAAPAAAAAAAAADSPSSEISRSQDKKPRQSSKASKAAAIPLSQNPPSQADVEAAVSQIAANSKISGWTPEAIRFKAFTIWNHYELKQWKRADGTDATDLNSCVFCWMKRDGFKPPVMDDTHQQTPAPVPSSGLLPAQKTSGAAEKQKSFKQMQQEWIERPLTDPEACTVEDAAHLIFNARSEGEAQGVLNSIPVHLREKALALANEKRKEQGDRPRIISPLPYEEDDS